MKNFKLNRLLSYSHEKRSPQRFARYAAMLMMLLTLGVGQMWARTYDGTEKLYIKNIKPGSWDSHWISGTGQVLWVQFDGNSSTNTAATYISGSGTLYSDSYYELTVPSGTYTNIVIYRGASLGSSWNNTGSISLNSTANVIDGGYSEGGTGATWNTFLDISTPTVIYFNISTWWNNTNCYHYVEFSSISGTTTTLPAYNYDSYINNNANDLSTASSSADNKIFFVTLPVGVYKSYKMDRKKSDSSSAEQWNQSGECTFVSSTGKNQVGTMSSGETMSTWNENKPTSTCGLDADETEVTLNTAVTLTPSLSSNTLLNTYKSVSYSVNTGTSGTHWTIDGNTFTPLVAGTYTITANITYYAKGFPDLTTTTSAGSTSPTVTVTATAPDTYYDVTFGVGTDYSSYGDLTARNTTDGVDLTSVASVLAGKAITFTASPSQTYYEVKGFYSDAACTSSLQSGNSTTYTIASLGDDANVYVKFGLKNYAITYNNMSGATNHISNPETYNYETATITLGTPTKTGYTFGGWYPDEDFEEDAVTSIPNHSSGDVILYAKWTAKTYTVNFDQQDGTGGSSSVTATYGSDMPSATMPTRSGYDFGGYYTEEDGGGTQYYAADGSSARTWNIDVNNTTLYAKWLEKTIVYVLKTKHANSSLGDGATNFPSDGQIWAWASSSGANFYTSPGKHPGPTASSVATTYTDGIVGDEWWCFTPDNTSAFTNTTAYHIQLMSTNQILNTQTTFIENESSHSASTHTGTIWVVPHGTDANTAYLYTSYPDEVATPYNTAYYAGDYGSINVFGTSISSGSNQTIATTKNRTLTATPASGYGFERWITTGGASVADAFSASTTVSATSAGGTVTAKWYTKVDSKFYVIGDFAGGAWTDVETHPLDRYYPGESTVYYRTVTVDAVDKYFRFFKKESSNHAYGASSNNLLVTKGIENKVDANRDNGNNFKYSAGGTVWVVLDATNNKCWIQDPDEKTYYTVTFGKGTGGSDISAEDGESNSLTSGVAYEEGISITFTQTAASGYSFKEWNTRSDGSGEQLGTDAEGYSITSLDADVSVYAIYNETLYTCTVSCDANYGSASMSGSVSLGATPRAISVTAKEWCNFDSWVTTGGVSVADAYDPSTTVTASNTGTLTATFNTNKIIYFDNSASNWNDENGIWVYLFSSTYGVWYDDEVNGGVHPGVNRLEYGRMTRIGTSKIYYYKYSTNTTIAGVAFTKADQHNYTAFNGTSAAWLPSFNTCQPCYIASYVYTSKNGVGYHSTGYWKKYGTYDSGFSLWIYYNGLYHENKFTTTDPTSFVYTTSDELTSAGSAYNYHVTRCAGSNLRRKDYNGAIAASDSDYPRELIDNASDGTITTSSAGEYNFTLDLSGDHIYMYTEYPLTVGDYRVVLNNGTKDHPSGRIVRARSESVSDTVSFFINKDATNALHVDTCKSTYPSVVWETIKDVSASGLSLNKGPYKSTTGVYNFTITHSRYKDVSLDSITDEKKVYTGNYYIRTDAADGRWKTYMTTPDNKLQHSAKSLNTEAQYDYYFTKYILKDANVQFTIANDYSPCIADTLYGDTYTGGADESHQTLLKDANVRFMWNSGTNTITRAYLDPATVEGSHFIELHSSDSKLFSSSATDDTHGDPLTSIVFTDTKNWIYQADVKALPNAVATLTAEYNDNNIDIISGGSEQKLFGGDDTDNVTLYPLRMVYDFKTNILVSAWIAETNQAIGATNLALDADLMIVRKLQQPAAQITFTTGSLSDVKTIYGALRFDYDDMVGNLSSWTGNYGKLIYDVSFPFDVNVKDIFGFGNMDDHWVVQKYNGARRAKEGWHQESKPFWETLTEDSVMHAYEGYTVIIDRPSFNSSTSVVWQNKEEGSSVYLYFPSASVDKKTISKGSVTLHLDSLNCKKDQWFTDPTTSQRLNHKFTDSNWRMLGVPLLSDTSGNFSSLFKSIVDYTDENPFGYLYTWSIYDNSYSITSTADFTFKSMHSYMVQFAGDVTFKGSYVHAQGPSRIVAAKQAEDERQYIIELQMRNAHNADIHTYVELRENACDTFALNEDVYMVRSSSVADLYTFAGAYDVAANVLSVGNHIIPVGMDVKQSGAYTFSMPNNFKGTVTLVDTYANTRTNLSLDEYEVYLNQGAINDRFYLDIDIQEIVTSLENIDGNNSINDGGAHKFLQNGQMYILKNGVIFDARGNRIK